MKKLGLSIAFVYRFVCDCQKILACRFSGKSAGGYLVAYRQCECCSRIYKISIEQILDKSGDESQVIEALMTKIKDLTFEISQLNPKAELELLNNPETDL